MSKKISSRIKMPRRILLFLISTSFILFVLSLGYFLFVNSDQTNNTPYYKASGAQNTNLTIITQKESWSKQNPQNLTELFAKKTIVGTFVAQADNLGIIEIPFDTHNRSIDDKVIFRIKANGEKNWYFQSVYNAGQFQTDVPFPFGIPVIKNSRNNRYTFEIESLDGRPNNSISLSKASPYFFSKYKFSKAELTRNPLTLIQFIVVKAINQLPLLTGYEIVILALFILAPFLLYFVLIDSIRRFKKWVEATIHLISAAKIKTYLSRLKRVNYNLRYALDRKDKIRLCCSIISVGLFSSVAFHYFQGAYYGQGFPRNTFIPNWFFGDFFAVFEQWRNYQFNGIGFGLSYFPGTYLFMDLMTKLFNAYVAVLIMLISFTVFLFAYTYKNVKINKILESLRNAFIISLMSYPFLFAFQTANLEIITFIAVCLFFIFYKKHKTLSVLALAYAISMKLFPGVFIILLLLEKRFKDIFLTCVFTVFFTILPLLIFDGGFNKGIGNYINNFKGSQQLYSNLMILGESGNHYGHSLLNGFRALFPWVFPSSIEPILFSYIIFISIITLAIIGYLFFFEKTFWKRVACLVMMMNLFPFTSTDYKLLYIFLPLFFLINHLKKSKYDAIFIILFSLLLIPKDYFYFNNNAFSNLNVVANPIIMSTILLLIIFLGIKQSLGKVRNTVNNKLFSKIA
ncbi:MAG: glycosyltransferase family 87 protein [Candidatus Levyibacteriota bacterium]